jgi:co-chaperonin GroES (HSP10)
MSSFADSLEITDQLPGVNPYSTGIEVEGTLGEFFPDGIDPGFTPFGSRVVVQLRRVKNTTKSGIILTTSTKETEAWNTQVARIVKLGPLAFRKRDTAEEWPEGIWAKVGDYVRVPRWGGDRWSVKADDGGEVAFLTLNDHELIGRVDGDPLKVRAYVI